MLHNSDKLCSMTPQDTHEADLDITINPSKINSSISVDFNIPIEVIFPAKKPTSNVIQCGSSYEELYSSSKLIYDTTYTIQEFVKHPKNAKYKQGHYMQPVINQLSQQAHQEMVSNLCFQGLFTLMEGLNPKTIRGLFIQCYNNKDTSISIFNSSVMLQFFTKLIEPFYAINFDFNLYSEQLIIFKSFLDLYAKILEFLACEMFSHLKIQFKREGINSFERFMNLYLLIECKTVSAFQREIVDKFIMCSVSFLQF